MSLKIIENLKGQVFQNGYETQKTQGTAIIGMSPGNSYFNAKTIEELVAVCTKQFEETYVFIASVPATHTYRALGKDKINAARLARLKTNNLIHHIERAAQKLEKDTNNKAGIKIIDWNKDITPKYTQELKEIYALYKINTQFRDDCRNTTKQVIEHKLAPDADVESAIDKGVNYLLKEFAALSALPKILGKKQISYVYHHHWNVYEQYVNGNYGIARKDLGLIIIADT